MLYWNHNLHSSIDLPFKNYKDIEITPERLLKNSFKKNLLQNTFQLNFKKIKKYLQVAKINYWNVITY